ncbi:hypothetical protein MMN56_18405, partial [Escherichia coli]|uniref:hypothetical protein n=1 Tax=Escherichia coli TaxID=562 RepID=UPI001F12C632
RHRSVRLVILVGLAIDQIAQSGLSSLSVIYYSAQLFRARWLHGGGSSLRDPYAPRQGWKPTMGCTRAQNEDVDELCKKVTSWMYSHPGERIRYERFKTR